MDMASSHYHSDVIQWLEENRIEYVKKSENTPNLPQARPIEKFWALCKREYGKRKKPAKNLADFTRIWRKIAEKVADESGANLMKHVRGTLSKINVNGVYSVLQ